MKMKQVFLGFLILPLSVAMLISCVKRKVNEIPKQDSDTETSVDVVWATQVVTDIIQLGAFVGEDLSLKTFYDPTPESYNPSTATGSALPTRDINEKFVSMAYNNTQCMDGKYRQGSLFMRYGPDPKYNPNSNPNSIYFRDFGFVGRLTLSAYKVDGWNIVTESYDGVAGGPVVIYNLLEKDDYNPAITKLKWRIVGRFIFIHPSDPSKNMVWDGDITKTLNNSTDPRVFNATTANKNRAINWYNANVSYQGIVKGTTSNGAAYTMTLNANNPLVRDFTCYPEKLASISFVTNTTVSSKPLEYHPFISGIASFKTGDKYVRQIYFGAEGSDEGMVQCDNSGEVLIKGISYKIDFRK